MSWKRPLALTAQAASLVIVTAALLAGVGTMGYQRALTLSVAYGQRVAAAARRDAFDLTRDRSAVVVRGGPEDAVIRCIANKAFYLPLTITNLSTTNISSGLIPGQSDRVNAACLTFGADDTQVAEGARSFLAKPLAPGRSAVVPVRCRCLDQPGTGRIQGEVVQEGVAWQHDVTTAEQYVVARLEALSPEAQGRGLSSGPFVQQDLPVIQGLDADQEKLVATVFAAAQRQLLGDLHAERSTAGVAYTLGAGSAYPMAWVRDLATVQRGWRYLDESAPSDRSHWGDLFLEVMDAAGNVPDRVALGVSEAGSKRETGKNTVQSDQELWLIIGMLEAVDQNLRLPAWLDAPVGRWPTRRAGLAAALRFVLSHRWDGRHHCLFSGHIADWGDVGLTGTGSHDSTQIEHGHPIVCGVFLQALLFEAMQLMDRLMPEQLALVMRPFGGQDQMTQHLRAFASSAWRDGYFQIHQHLDSHEHAFDESALFPLGGNVVAALIGLATSDQAAAIAATILDRQRQAGLPTVGGVLIPPYPAGTYENPIMDEAYEYQNGGQWDWFAGRAIEVLARHNPAAARQALVEVARQIDTSGGFFEWYTRSGEGRGSADFRAGAAAFIAAAYAIHEASP